MMTLESTARRRDVPWRNIDGNVIVVQPKEGILYPLNSVATKIWLLSDGTHSISEMVKAVAEEFEEERGQIEKDTLLFLEALGRADLIEIGPKG